MKSFHRLSFKELNSNCFIVCSERSIRCRHLSFWIKVVKENSPVLVAMPEVELEKGSRGWAKTEILLSIKGIKGVIACSDQDLKRLVSGKFGKVIQMEKIQKKSDKEVKIERTSTSVDLQFMKKAQKLVPKSICWWRPTACVFTRKNKIVLTSASINSWRTDCKELFVKPTNISLAAGEQISFCDAIHAEKAGIAKAARKGVSLDGVTLYVTVCPCEECAKELIEAGVKRVVFDSEYYNRVGLLLLKKNRIKIAKIKNGKR